MAGEANSVKGAASKLFGLINLIVVTMISARNQIAEMFDSLPDGAKEAIEKRDAARPISLPNAAVAIKQRL